MIFLSKQPSPHAVHLSSPHDNHRKRTGQPVDFPPINTVAIRRQGETTMLLKDHVPITCCMKPGLFIEVIYAQKSRLKPFPVTFARRGGGPSLQKARPEPNSRCGAACTGTMPKPTQHIHLVQRPWKALPVADDPPHYRHDAASKKAYSLCANKRRAPGIA